MKIWLPAITFSVLLLVPVGAQSAYAGFSCTLSPDDVTLTLEQGETSDPITKMIDCTNSNNPIGSIQLNPTDCRDKGIDVFTTGPQFGFSTYQTDETITNTGGTPGQTHCQVIFIVSVPSEPDANLFQNIWITTPDQVGGEFLPIESTSLLLAGAQSFSWMIPLVLAGLGIGLFVASRKSENS